MEKISIVIPVYNVQNYLRRCLDSLVSHNIYEIILVDDGSKDDSLKICYDYQKKFSNIKVFTQQNSGPSAARNKGILNSTGDYICFVDSDDFVTNNINSALDNVKKVKSDFYMFSYNLYDDQNNEQKINNILNDDVVDVKNIDIIKQLIVSEKINTLWNKIYKKKIIEKHHIEFNKNINLAEDLLFNLEYLSKCKKIYISNLSYYNYCLNNVNSLTRKYNASKLDTLMNANELIKPVLSELNVSKLSNYLLYKNLFSVIFDLHNPNCKYSFKEKQTFIANIKKQYKSILIYDCGLLMLLWTFVYSISPVLGIYLFTKIRYKLKNFHKGGKA